MKCFRHKYVLPMLLLFLTFKRAVSLKCYQCSSTTNPGCFTYDLKRRYLMDCPSRSANSDQRPICRHLSQVQFFTADQEVTVVRECAYVYTEPLKCNQSKFSSMHYSLSCECDYDGCNRAPSRRTHWKIIVLAVLWVLVIK